MATSSGGMALAKKTLPKDDTLICRQIFILLMAMAGRIFILFPRKNRL